MREEEACNSAYACIDGEMLGKNMWVCGKGRCAVCVDLQAVGVLEFLSSLVKGFGTWGLGGL